MHERAIRSNNLDVIAAINEAPREETRKSIGVVCTRKSVALIIKLEKILLIGVRSTQFAYDWRVNLKIRKEKIDRDDNKHVLVHDGFRSKAMMIGTLIVSWLLDNEALKDRIPIYVSGHSLGGAIAAIMLGAGMREYRGASKRYHWVDGCYTFGAPKIGDVDSLYNISGPSAVRRPEDIVPHVPPGYFGYSYFLDQRSIEGNFFQQDRENAGKFIKWLWLLMWWKFAEEHSLEKYVSEVLEIIGKQSGIPFSPDEAEKLLGEFQSRKRVVPS